MQTTSATVAKFTYPTYRRLEFMLGRIDAIATFAEFLIRKLLSDASNSGGMEKYLRSLAAENT